MVAAGSDGDGPAAADHSEKLLDFSKRIHQVNRIDRAVAQIRYPQCIIRRDTVGVDAADQAGLVAYLARTMAGAGSVGGAAIERHADQSDINQRRIL